MKLNKDDIYGIIGSLAFHAIILLILGFTVLKAVVPEEEGGVLVNFGNVNAAAGTFEPKYTGRELPQETTPPPPPSAPETSQEKLITQNIEESISLEEEKKKKEEEERKRKEEAEKERIRREEAERKRLEEERRKKEEAIKNRVAGAFGIGSSQENSSQGDAESGVGNQGNPFGNSDHGANEGIGGMGSFSLSNRQLITGKLAEPAYTENKEGKIVIDIIVDTKGNVIRADIGRGTTIEDVGMREKAKAAARKNRFNEISGVNNQSGTITYVYKLN